MTQHMPIREVTINLLRKRSEHNESMISTLEELALHQEELTRIGPYLSKICGKTLQILLLQNNVIGDIGKDLRRCCSLRYLNLALNNLTVVRGLESCEFLNKLDLTLNFIDVDTLIESLENLRDLEHLRELFMVGNPCAEHPLLKENGVFRLFLVHMLPQLSSLDGIEIGRTERIKAAQKCKEVRKCIIKLAAEKRLERQVLLSNSQRQNSLNDELNDHDSDDAVDEEIYCDSQQEQHQDHDELTGHTPQARIQLSNEMAHQKLKKEEREAANAPKFKTEDEMIDDQLKKSKQVRETVVDEDAAALGRIRMKNEGKWDFRFDEESREGYLLLHVSIQKHLSLSLIDVDVHPTHINVVIKSKVLRLILPTEVKVHGSRAERSKTTGHLLVIMPKLNPDENLVTIRANKKVKEKLRLSEENSPSGSGGKGIRRKIILNEEMYETGLKELKDVVSIQGIFSESNGGILQSDNTNNNCTMLLKHVKTTGKGGFLNQVISSSDEPPDMF